MDGQNPEFEDQIAYEFPNPYNNTQNNNTDTTTTTNTTNSSNTTYINTDAGVLYWELWLAMWKRMHYPNGFYIE